MKISFHSYANKTNFHMKSFALSFAFIVWFTATRKWRIPFCNVWHLNGILRNLPEKDALTEQKKLKILGK